MKYCCENCNHELFSMRLQLYRFGVLVAPGRVTTCFGTLAILPSQSLLLWALLKAAPNTITHRSINTLYESYPVGGGALTAREREGYDPRNTIAVSFSKMRNDLLTLGLSIETVWGIGYRLLIPRVVQEGALDVSPAT